MFKLLREVVRGRGETVRYPFAPLEVNPDFRGRPEHKAEDCIACAACTIACPANALRMETDVEAGTRVWSISYGRCIFCGRCEEVCPTHAITLTPDFELAVLDKKDLVRTATFALAPCVSCGTPFAPRKEIDYVIALTEKAASAPELPELMDSRRRLIATCPACKRTQEAIKIGSFEKPGARGR